MESGEISGEKDWDGQVKGKHYQPSPPSCNLLSTPTPSNYMSSSPDSSLLSNCEFPHLLLVKTELQELGLGFWAQPAHPPCMLLDCTLVSHHSHLTPL